MGLEGAFRVGLRLEPGRIARVSVSSTRPDIAQTMLLGRSVAEAEAAVPVLFSICAQAQAAACRLACAAAAGETLGDPARAAAQAGVAAETLRETAWHALLNGARWRGEEPAPAAVAAARAALAGRGGQVSSPTARDIAVAAFGRPAGAWLQVGSWPELQAWAADGDTAAARYVHDLVLGAQSHAECDASVKLLPRPGADWLTPLADAIAADPDFAQRPTWRGAAAETGALARLRDDPLFDPPRAQAGVRLLGRSGLRFVARLRELARLLNDPADGHGRARLGALSQGTGHGLAWVESARGLLLHQVRLSSGRITGYRIVAPTAWNFHPRGALAAALEGARVGDAGTALALATRVVQALDPCVPCRVELDHA